MACEPFDCEKCGHRHERCSAHVDLYDDEGNLVSYLPCKKWPLREMRVCDKHGGAAPRARAKALREREEGKIRREVQRLGIPIEIDPTEALLGEIWETVGNIEFLRNLVQELPTHPDDDKIVGFNDKNDAPIYERGEPGIYGKTYHLSGTPTGEAKMHVLVQMYNDERKHLVNVTSAAIRLGIEERRVNLEENRAAEVFRAVSQALSLMGLEARFSEFREHFADAIRNGQRIPAGIGAGS